MANRLEGVDKRVLECAKQEFLEYGFKDASLRRIAGKADTSTGSIYTRFKDKEGIFRAIVKPVVDDLLEWFWSEQDTYSKKNDSGSDEAFDYSKDKIIVFVEYIYNHYDEFKLLLENAEGTDYANFVHKFVDIDVKYTLEFMQKNNSELSKEMLHIFTSAFYTGIFETILHDMNKEDAFCYVKKLQDFFQAGWRELL